MIERKQKNAALIYISLLKSHFICHFKIMPCLVSLSTLVKYYSLNLTDLNATWINSKAGLNQLQCADIQIKHQRLCHGKSE